MTLNSEGLEKAWRFDIQHGPDGEANYAWVYNGKDLVATMRTHHAISIVEAMNRRALPPVDGLEVVANLPYRLRYAGATLKGDLGQTLMDAAEALSQASSVIAGFKEERDHWKANHDQMVQRNLVLRERPDLPADRLPSIARYEARISSLEEENKRLREALGKLAHLYESDCDPEVTARPDWLVSALEDHNG